MDDKNHEAKRHKEVTSQSSRRRLSNRVLEELGAGQSIWDAEVRGFGARRQLRDVSFVLKYVFLGRQRFYTIGRFGILTVDEARKEARRLLGAVAAGNDPSVASAKLGTKPLTVGELCGRYLAEGPSFRPDKKESSWTTDRSNILRHILPVLGDLLAESLSESDVARLMSAIVHGVTRIDEKTGHRGRAIVRGGKGVAARTLAVLGAAFTFGMKVGLVARNPTTQVKPAKTNSPGRFLSDAEWARLGEAMREFRRRSGNSAFLDAIQLLALTGCRRSEVTLLQWADVDLERGFLRLRDSKTGQKTVVLGEAAAALLISLQGAAKSYWVFPSGRGDGPIIGIQKVWSSLRGSAGLAGLRLHDLRHSFASQAVNSGASLYLTGAVLGHRQAATTQRYAHLQADPVRAVATEASEKIRIAMETKP